MRLTIRDHALKAAGLWIVGSSLCGVLMASDGAMMWPQFRGPDANPISNDARLPVQWNTTENIEWSAEIPGRGWSSPIVFGDQVFVTTTLTEGPSKSPQTGTEFSNEYVAELSQQGLSQEEILKRITERDIELPHEVTVTYVLLCLDLKSGRELWRNEYHHGQPPGGRHRKNSFTSESPVTDGKQVYVHAGNLGLYAFSMDGKLVWNQALEKHPIYLDFGTGSSPVLAGNRVIVVNDNEESSYIGAWDVKTGEPLWFQRRGSDQGDAPMPTKSGWVTPYVWKNSQREELIVPGPDTLIAYDLDGNTLWSMRGMGLGLAASSFAVGDQLIVNGGRGRPIFSVRPGASGDITLDKSEDKNEFIEWSKPRAGTYIPTPVAYDGGLYIITDNGILTRLDLKSGEQSYRTRVKGTEADFTSSPWAYNGRVFLASEQGDVFVVKAGSEYVLEHVNPMGEMAMATPAMVGDRLLLRTDKRLMSVRNATGS